MKRLFFAVLLLFSSGAHASPEGLWRVIGDKSGVPEALVRISVHDGVLQGKIVKVLPRPGIDPDALCENCPAKLKNRPVAGLTILTRMRQEGDEYNGGEILDPDSGETYHCSMKLSDDGSKLLLRGYVLIPLFGRTETWIRETP